MIFIRTHIPKKEGLSYLGINGMIGIPLLLCANCESLLDEVEFIVTTGQVTFSVCKHIVAGGASLPFWPLVPFLPAGPTGPGGPCLPLPQLMLIFATVLEDC